MNEDSTPHLLTDPQAPPPPPATVTGPRAVDFWSSVVARYALRQDELILLEHAARLVAIVDHLSQALHGEPLVVKGSMGQPAPHPLLGELRAHRSQLAAMLKQLGLPDELTDTDSGEGGGDVVLMTASDLARKAARARWSKHRKAAH